MKLTISIALAMALLSTTLIGQKPNGGDPDLARKIARFAPTTLAADTSKLTPKDRQALDKIIAAARLLDPLKVTNWPTFAVVVDAIRAAVGAPGAVAGTAGGMTSNCTLCGLAAA